MKDFLRGIGYTLTLLFCVLLIFAALPWAMGVLNLSVCAAKSYFNIPMAMCVEEQADGE